MIWASAANLNVVGIVLNAIGVVLLFRFGMPYRIRTGGEELLATGGSDETAKISESRYDVLGYIGLGFIVLGAVSQITAVYI